MIDLHTHSFFSDGSDSPAKLLELAKTAGCEAISLTDHDTIDGISEALLAADAHGVELIAGVELSCHTSTRNIHILGYFVDHTDEIFKERLVSQQRLRNERNQRLVERLNELDMAITLTEVEQIAGVGSIGRPHFAAAMVNHGYVSSIEEAFLRFLANGGPAYVERQELPADIAIQWIKEAGGVASWAHPEWRGLGEAPNIEPVVEELASFGLTGIEALYSRYGSDQRKGLKRLAKKHGLVATGGSDYHGTYKPDLSLGRGVGDLAVPYEVIAELRAKTLKK